MILTVEELKEFITTTESDKVLEMRLQALESYIRKYTNNTFENMAFRKTADIVGGLFVVEAKNPFTDGDTVLIRGCGINYGLYTVKNAGDTTFEVKEPVVDEHNVSVTKVVYPMDVKMGVVELMKWSLEKGSKVGIQSETISRHSVTYYDMSGDNFYMGYPKSLFGFLKPYRKARF